MPSKQKLIKPAILLLAALSFTACGKKEAEYVEVQATEEPPAEADLHAGHDHADHAAHGELAFAYELPEGWSVLPTANMQLLTIEAGSPPNIPASMSVSAFPGDVGGQLANINRWRRQVGLGPVSPEAVDGFVSEVSISGMEGWKVDFTGPAPSAPGHEGMRVVVSSISHSGQSWFFKLMGTESAVAEELDHYQEFLATVAF